MYVDELIPDKTIRWTCIGAADEWKDTKLSWEIIPKDGNQTISANDSICILTGVLLVCRNWFITDKNVDGFILAS